MQVKVNSQFSALIAQDMHTASQSHAVREGGPNSKLHAMH